MVKCYRCGNEDIRFFGIRSDGLYCRKCISFQGEEVDQAVFCTPSAHEYNLSYILSKEQQSISKKVLSSFKRNKDVLIHAVCGAGKTELVFETISYALKNKLRVGFTIPRKDVVVELYLRIKKARQLKELYSKGQFLKVYGIGFLPTGKDGKF